MIINNEHNRTNLEVSTEEALELIAELSNAVNHAIKYGHRTTNGMAASERINRNDILVKATGFKPSSFNVTVSK